MRGSYFGPGFELVRKCLELGPQADCKAQLVRGGVSFRRRLLIQQIDFSLRVVGWLVFVCCLTCNNDDGHDDNGACERKFLNFMSMFRRMCSLGFFGGLRNWRRRRLGDLHSLSTRARTIKGELEGDQGSSCTPASIHFTYSTCSLTLKRKLTRALQASPSKPIELTTDQTTGTKGSRRGIQSIRVDVVGLVEAGRRLGKQVANV